MFDCSHLNFLDDHVEAEIGSEEVLEPVEELVSYGDGGDVLSALN